MRDLEKENKNLRDLVKDLLNLKIIKSHDCDVPSCLIQDARNYLERIENEKSSQDNK